jgi:hypothetical protein
MGQINPTIATDPTGGAQKYLDQLDSLKFNLNPEDEIYKWREEQTRKTIDQAAAARGMYNSRPTINAQSDANMALQGQEVDRQFNQNYLAQQNQLQNLYNMALGIGGTQYGKSVDDYTRKYGQAADQFGMATQLGGIKYGQAADTYNRGYGQNMDAYNMSSQIGQTQYNKLLDAIKAGQGAAGAMGSIGANTAGGLASTYSNLGSNLGNIAMQQGQNNQSFWGGMGAMPMNYMMLQQLMGGGSSSGLGGVNPNGLYWNRS